MSKEKARLRIAPSPTGLLHIGTARLALFNWLYARKIGATLILRVEDTDTERSTREYEKDIIEGLGWLGINWDEGPYRQSERGEIYEIQIKKLLSERRAYYCFCTKEELESERQSMLVSGQPPKYNGRCRNLSDAEVKKKISKGAPSVIRFKMPEGRLSFSDMIRGKIEFDMALVGDIAIAKDERTPLYNLAVVIDDYDMKISHVVRGEDHLANTPKQIALQEALGFHAVQYAHLPLILNPDRSKMSKRFSATSIGEYRKAGYLKEALINFLALLGWHPEHERELFTINELIGEFDLARAQKSGAAFNQEKLDWINNQYLKKLSSSEILERMEEISEVPRGLSHEQMLKALETVKTRLKKLSDFAELAGFFFALPEYAPRLLIWKETPKEKIRFNLKEAFEALNRVPKTKFTAAELPSYINPLAETYGKGEVLWPLRVALSGKDASPGPFEIMDVLGKEETIKRVTNALQALEP